MCPCIGGKFKVREKMNTAVLKYLTLDWDCQFESRVTLPAFKGSMLRGTLGHALKSTVCAVRIKICDNCLLRQNCLYARIFEYKPNSLEGRSQAALPHPYVLEYPTNEQTYEPGDNFRFRLIILGSYVESLPYWIYSIQQMGERGLGPRGRDGNRARFRLKNVLAAGQRIFDESTSSLVSVIPTQELNWTEPPNNIQRIRIELQTPLRTKDHNRLATDLDFPLLIRLGLRRLQSFNNAFGVRIEPENITRLLHEAKEVRMVDKQIRWHEQLRYSTRQQERQQFGGLIGDLEFEGNLEPFWPLLRIAEIVHLGKETSFGLGKLKLVLP